MILPRTPRFQLSPRFDRYRWEAFNRERKGAFRRKYGARRLPWRSPRYEPRQHESWASTMRSLERFMFGGRA